MYSTPARNSRFKVRWFLNPRFLTGCPIVRDIVNYM